VSATVSEVALDQVFTITAGKSYSLSVMLPTGALETRTVTNAAGDFSAITVAPAFSIAPESGAPWVMQEDAEGIRTFRVISLTENDGKITVLASLYNETKFSTTDNATILSKPRISLATTQIVPAVVNGSIILGVPSDVAPA
jgi:predicted phage tail protein